MIKRHTRLLHKRPSCRFAVKMYADVPCNMRELERLRAAFKIIGGIFTKHPDEWFTEHLYFLEDVDVHDEILTENNGNPAIGHIITGECYYNVVESFTKLPGSFYNQDKDSLKKKEHEMFITGTTLEILAGRYNVNFTILGTREDSTTIDIIHISKEGKVTLQKDFQFTICGDLDAVTKSISIFDDKETEDLLAPDIRDLMKYVYWDEGRTNRNIYGA